MPTNVAVPAGEYTEIEYMSRNIGAVTGPNVDSKMSVIQEVNTMFANGWKLFATHFGGQQGAGIIVLHIFVR